MEKTKFYYSHHFAVVFGEYVSVWADVVTFPFTKLKSDTDFGKVLAT